MHATESMNPVIEAITNMDKITIFAAKIGTLVFLIIL